MPLTGRRPGHGCGRDSSSPPIRTIKGMWCVPKYSNPTGTVYSHATIHRLATMKTAAADFRLFWDNAYAVHHLTAERVEIDNIDEACARAGHPNRAFIFGSTSKITFAGAGVGSVRGLEGQRRVVSEAAGHCARSAATRSTSCGTFAC